MGVFKICIHKKEVYFDTNVIHKKNCIKVSYG